MSATVSYADRMLRADCQTYQAALDRCDPYADSLALIYLAAAAVDERRGLSRPGATVRAAIFLEQLRQADSMERWEQARVKRAVLDELAAEGAAARAAAGDALNPTVEILQASALDLLWRHDRPPQARVKRDVIDELTAERTLSSPLP